MFVCPLPLATNLRRSFTIVEIVPTLDPTPG